MLSQFILPALGALGCALAVAVLTGPVRAWLVRAGIHDTPNARSSHTEVKPRGGGLAVLAVVLASWLAAGWLTGVAVPMALVGLCVFIAAVSFVDDVVGLKPAVRFLAQGAAVVAGLAALDPAPLLPELLPLWLERVVVAIAWLWFVNLYNFMDGIDGITAVETGSVAFGIGLVWLVIGAGVGQVTAPWLLAGAAVGFLWWNWAPSKVFLGDVGSVPLGFVLGWLLLDLAAAGVLASALILPAYYLLDATLTLLLRLARREKVWLAHKEHAYQRAVQRGLSHGVVAGRIAMLNGALIALALWAATGSPWQAGCVAGVLTLGLWALLLRSVGRQL